MLSSPTLPNPLESLEGKARQNPTIASLETRLQSYVLILGVGLVAIAIALVATLVYVSTRTPDYKLGTTIYQAVTPVPFSQIGGVVPVKVNLITAHAAKDLKAFVKSGNSPSSELTIDVVGQNVIQLNGAWDTKNSEAPMLEISLYDVSIESSPILVGYFQLPVSQ